MSLWKGERLVYSDIADYQRVTGAALGSMELAALFAMSRGACDAVEEIRHG